GVRQHRHAHRGVQLAVDGAVGVHGAGADRLAAVGEEVDGQAEDAGVAAGAGGVVDVDVQAAARGDAPGLGDGSDALLEAGPGRHEGVAGPGDVEVEHVDPGGLTGQDP